MVTVFQSKFITGIRGEVDIMLGKHKQGILLPLQTALVESYATDAHFVPYYLMNRESKLPQYYYRVNKGFCAHECTIAMTAKVFDVDMPKHQALTSDFAISVIEKVFEHAPESILYTTKNGLRFILQYDRIHNTAEHETQMQADIIEYRKKGIPCDWLFDYTRFFRLPFVIRDGEETHSIILNKDNANEYIRDQQKSGVVSSTTLA